jgi:hypothetical protein
MRRLITLFVAAFPLTAAEPRSRLAQAGSIPLFHASSRFALRNVAAPGGRAARGGAIA